MSIAYTVGKVVVSAYNNLNNLNVYRFTVPLALPVLWNNLFLALSLYVYIAL